MIDRPAGLFAMRAVHQPLLFPPRLMKRVVELCDIDATVTAEDFTDEHVRRSLADTEILITGWGCPRLDAETLDLAPRLRAVLHAAGSVKAHVTPACWDRGLLISSATAANAVPVAEYVLAVILMAGKGVFASQDRYRRARSFPLGETISGIGNFGLRVGIVGASRVGRRLIELLRPFDVEVYLSDPYVDTSAAVELGVRLTDLDTMLATCDVTSLNAPMTPQTHHLIDRQRLALMRDGTTLVNTARGPLVDTTALTGELVSGRLSAVLDVTDPEPLPPDSPLFDLPNVFLTPHIAGSHGNELERLGESTVDELERLVSGHELAHLISPSDMDRVA